MRVLFLTDSFRPSRSACANRASVLVEAMLNSGIDVQVLASSDSILNTPENYIKPEYVTFFSTFPLIEKTLVNRLKNNFGGCKEAYKVAKRMGHFDLVICSTPPLILTQAAIKIAEINQAKLILDVRDIWPDVAYEMGSFAPKSIYGRFFSMLSNRAYKQADLIVTVTPGKVTKLSSRVPLEKKDNIILVPNGIDESFLNERIDADLVKKFDLNSGPICSYVGNIGLAQGLESLLVIAENNPNVRFLLFGKGAEEEILRKCSQKKNLSNVEFCGTLDAAGVFTVLKYSALAYVPLKSSNLKDSIPTKMYEAFACGCPVLLAAEGDSVELLKSVGLGMHAAPEDINEQLGSFSQLLSRSYSEDERHKAILTVSNLHSRQKSAKEFAAKLLDFSNLG